MNTSDDNSHSQTEETQEMDICQSSSQDNNNISSSTPTMPSTLPYLVKPFKYDVDPLLPSLFSRLYEIADDVKIIAYLQQILSFYQCDINEKEKLGIRDQVEIYNRGDSGHKSFFYDDCTDMCMDNHVLLLLETPNFKPDNLTNIIGFILFYSGREKLIINQCAITPALRGRNYGFTMMKAFINYQKSVDMRYEYIKVNVAPSKSRFFWKGFGFTFNDGSRTLIEQLKLVTAADSAVEVAHQDQFIISHIKQQKLSPYIQQFMNDDNTLKLYYFSRSCAHPLCNAPKVVMRCAGCKRVVYCSKDCQLLHFKEHKHKCSLV